MRLARLALLLASVAVPAVAQTPPRPGTVDLRTGDHPTFTRLVFAAPGPVDWSVEQDGGVATIAFDGPVPRLDISNAFYWITRDRVAGIAQDGDALRLTMACDCAPSVVQYETGSW